MRIQKLSIGMVALSCLATNVLGQAPEQRMVIRNKSVFATASPEIRSDGVGINGGSIWASSTMNIREIASKSVENIKDRFKEALLHADQLLALHEYLVEQGNVLGEFTFMLDIEFAAHPSSLWQYFDPTHAAYDPMLTKQQVADIFSRRIQAVKEVAWENYGIDAKVGVFATLQPQSRGTPIDPTVLKRKANLIELAGVYGMLDNADFLMPLLYPRFDSTQSGHALVAEYTNQGLDFSAEILDSSGQSFPLFPLLSIRIFNPAAADGLIEVDWLSEQIELIRSSSHDVMGFMFWIDPGLDSDACAITYFQSLFAVNDWDLDCSYTILDDLQVLGAIGTGDKMADFNRDHVLNSLDFTDWTTTHSLQPVDNYPCDLTGPLCPWGSCP